MAERRGCLGGLLAIPLRLLSLGRGQRRIAQHTPIPQGLNPAEKSALSRAQLAAGQCRAVLHGAGAIDPAVLDQVGGSVDALMAQIHALAQRLASARRWLLANNPERISQALVTLEIEDTGSVVDRLKSITALKEQARHAHAVQAGLPDLAAKLTAAAHRLEALSARLTVQQLDATGLLSDIRRQESEVGRAVAAWQATVDEIESLV